MRVTKVIEHKDGSATIKFDVNKEELSQLLESAIRIGLLEGLKLVDEQRVQEFVKNHDN